MKQVDFFTGETALEAVSPPVSEAEQFAQFGQVHYQALPPPQPGVYGEYNPYRGIGYNQYHYGYYQQPNYTQPQQYQQFYQQQQPQDVIVRVPALNLWGSDYLPPDGYEEEIERLKWQYWINQEQNTAEAQIRSDQQFGYGYPNYYGMPYSMPSMYNQNNEYIEQLNRMQETARQHRLDMNINLSKLAHHYIGDDVDEKEISRIYTGYSYAIPGVSTIDIQNDQRLRNLQPFDNSAYYRKHDEEVSKQFKRLVKADDGNLNTFLGNLALVNQEYELEEEEHRRRQNLKSTYDSNGFRTIVKQHVLQNNLDKMARGEEQVRTMKQELLGPQMFPTLSHNASLADDGTLNIVYSYDPNQPTTHNQMEGQYDKERQRFANFLNSIPSALGGGP